MGMTGSVKTLLFFIVAVGLIHGDWIHGVYSDSSYLECAEHQNRKVQRGIKKPIFERDAYSWFPYDKKRYINIVNALIRTNVSLLSVGDSLNRIMIADMGCWFPEIAERMKHFNDVLIFNHNMSDNNRNISVDFLSKPSFFENVLEYKFIMINIGHWIHSTFTDSRTGQLRGSIELIDEILDNVLPLLESLPSRIHVIWRGLAHRHFEVGHDVLQNRGSRCVPSSPKHSNRSFISDYHACSSINSLLRSRLSDTRIHFLDIEETTKDRGDVVRFDKVPKGPDCVHFYYPGPQHVWNMMLLDHLERYVMCKMGMYSKTGLEPCYPCPAGRFSLPGQKMCA